VPGLRGVGMVSFLVGNREMSPSDTKLGEISEFLWENPENTPKVVVSFWENSVKNILLGLFKG